MSEWIISSSVLIVLVIALRHVLRGKISLRLQYALWLVVLVRLLMPVSVADSSFSIASLLQKNQTHQISDIFLWYGSESNPGGEGEYLPNRGEIGEQGNQQIGGEKPGNVTTPINPDAGAADKPPVSDEPVKSPTIGGISIAPSTDKLENSGKAHISLGEILMVIWCAGMTVTAIMLLVSNLHFNSKLQKTRWLYEKKTDSLPVYESDAVETPCLFGLVRPAVYVTKEAVKDPNVMHHVLAHETTHYAHRDHIWAVLRCLCLVLHWYNPLVWWAADLSRRDAELACDEGTIERIGEAVRVEYGRTLIGLTCQGRGYLLSTATTMTGSVKGIKERIMLIANRPKMARYTVMLLIVLVMVMIGCTYCGVKETDIGAGGKEESTESVEHVSESVDESTTEAVETETSTEEPIEETTEAVSEELPSEEATEEPTTEEPTTEEPTMPAEDDRFVSDHVIEVELQTDVDYYRINVDAIRKEGDQYVITGEKIYGGIVVLTVDQKEALDNGAMLRLMYEGKEVECIIANVLGDGEMYYFSKNSEPPRIFSSEHIETNVLIGNQKEAVIDALAKEPYNGVGYYFDSDLLGWKYNLVIEKDFSCTVAAELPIDPVCYKAYGNPKATGEWTIERFYEEAVVRDKWTFGPPFDVYTENGEIVRIYEPFTV